MNVEIVDFIPYLFLMELGVDMLCMVFYAGR